MQFTHEDYIILIAKLGYEPKQVQSIRLRLGMAAVAYTDEHNRPQTRLHKIK